MRHWFGIGFGGDSAAYEHEKCPQQKQCAGHEIPDTAGVGIWMDRAPAKEESGNDPRPCPRDMRIPDIQIEFAANSDVVPQMLQPEAEQQKRER